VDGLAVDGASTRRHPLRTAAVIAGGIVVVAALAAGGLFLWLRSYAPLETVDSSFAPGPGLGAVVQPVTGSLGRPVFFPAVRRRVHTFDTAFTLHNGGRFTVTVTGLVPPRTDVTPQISPATLLATTSATASADPRRLAPFTRLRLAPGDHALVVVRFFMTCTGATRATPDIYSDRLKLRYRYLSAFTRTQTVRLPFAVTLRCFGGPPATP
jgi:hypothetical protein